MPASRNSPLRGRGARAAWLGGLASLLAAQEMPSLPSLERTVRPSLGELLPLRPFETDTLGAGRYPFRWRGEKVEEGPDRWILERGAIQSDSLLLVADRIEYEPGTGEIRAEGAIRLEAEGVRLRCARLSMDWKKQVGEAYAMELELPPSWTLKSDRVVFTTLRHWDFQKVDVSPCPQDEPGWKAHLVELKLDLDGFAILRHASVWLGHVPVLYVPWAPYPANTTRSSGLLPPMLGSSSRLGATVGLSYYQVLGPFADATFNPEILTKEGVLWGGEVRWNPEPTHQGSVQGQSIHQQSDGQNRYRFGVKELWQREDGWQLTADINQASDNLMDADFGHGGAFLGGNPFDSAFYLGKSFQKAAFAITGSEQRTFFSPLDPFYRSDFPASLIRRGLPQVEARLFPVPIGPLYLDGSARTNRFSYLLDLGDNPQPEQERPRTRYAWSREDAALRLAGRIGQWGPLRVDFQTLGRATHYGGTLLVEGFDSSRDTSVNAAFDPFQVEGPGATRFLLSGQVKFSAPPLGRDYPKFKLFGWNGELKHVVEPFIAFNETSRFGRAGKLPRFDELDARPGVDGSASGEQSIELGLKQHFLARSFPGKPFLDLIRWRIGTRYHFRPVLLSDGRYQKGWSSVESDLDIEPDEAFRISFRRSADLVDGGADSAISAELKGKDGSNLSLAFFSTGINRFLVRQKGIQVGGLQRLWDDRFRLEFNATYDYYLKDFSNSQVGLAWVTPCVSTLFRFTHLYRPPGTTTPGGKLVKEDRLDVVLTLRGLGDLFTWRQ